MTPWRQTGARRLRSLAAIAAALVIVMVTGCQTNVAVRVVVRPDGSGRVTVDVLLDAQAASRAGDLLHQASLGDLRQAGWTVIGPVAQHDGGVRFTASKPFADSAGATRALAEVSGASGPLRDMRVERHRSLTRTRDVIGGEIDLSRGLDAFSDPALVAALGGKQLSQLVATLRSPADPPLSQALRLQLTVTLPDEVHASGNRITRHSVSWQAGAGDRPMSVEASGSREHFAALWYLVGVGAAAVLFLLSLWWAIRGIRRDRGARRESAKVEAESAEPPTSVAQFAGQSSAEAHHDATVVLSSDAPLANPAPGEDAEAVAPGPPQATSDAESPSLPVRRHRRSRRRRGGGKSARRRGRSAD